MIQRKFIIIIKNDHIIEILIKKIKIKYVYGDNDILIINRKNKNILNIYYYSNNNLKKKDIDLIKVNDLVKKLIKKVNIYIKNKKDKKKDIHQVEK